MGYFEDYRQEVVQNLKPLPPEELLLEQDMAGLPGAVTRYLRFTGAAGQPKVRNYRASFSGIMRQKQNGGWLKIHSGQYNFVDPSVRLFYIRSSLFGLPFDGYHRYVGDHAVMLVRVANLVRVVNARGPQMDQGETVTMFNDMCMLAPATLISPNIRWKEVDPLTVEAAFTNGSHTITATLIFSEDGALINFISNDRFMSGDGKSYLNYPWSTPVGGYREADGRRIPASGEAIWHTPQGLYTYLKFDSLEIDYNLNSFI